MAKQSSNGHTPNESSNFLNKLKALLEAGEYKEAVSLLHSFLSKANHREPQILNEMIKVTASITHQKPVAECYYIRCRITLGPKVPLADEWAAALHYDILNKGYQAEVYISHLPYK